MSDSPLAYQTGFRSAMHSETLIDAIPAGQNSPRKPAYGLHAEQLNGTAFTVPRPDNVRTWMYRIRPSVIHDELTDTGNTLGLDYLGQPPNPNLLGWRPRPVNPGEHVATNFIDSLHCVCGAGDPSEERGLAFYTYDAAIDMIDTGFYDADGDLMILPDTNAVRIRTELGDLRVAPGELAVIGRGMVFSVSVPNGPARGFVMEVYGQHFDLPQRGVVGSNGLADERHFRSPIARFEDREVPDGFEITAKLGGHLWRAHRTHSPYDVVGWHGNYAPYVYDMALYNAMGTVTWDHPDPSIFTVLSAPLDAPGENLADLVIFPNPRWDVAAHSMRPPFYHRNAATELNFILKHPSSTGVFAHGGYFITPPFTAHGVSPDSIERQMKLSDDQADAPTRIAGGELWAQFETTLPLRITPSAMQLPERDPEFRTFASEARVYFDPTAP
jgi:homogentisate 1,2-dioxygenase